MQICVICLDMTIRSGSKGNLKLRFFGASRWRRAAFLTLGGLWAASHVFPMESAQPAPTIKKVCLLEKKMKKMKNIKLPEKFFSKT